MKDITRKQFIGQIGVIGASFVLFNGCNLIGGKKETADILDRMFSKVDMNVV